MKKAQCLLTFAAAFAAGVSLATTDGETSANGVTPFDKLRLGGAEGSFSATTETTSGCKVYKADDKVTIEDSYYVVESELADSFPLTVIPTGTPTRAIAKFDVTFKASFVDSADLSGDNVNVGDAKIGFALTSGTSASYYNGKAWGQLTEWDTPVVEETEYCLHVDYDNRAEKKARFTLTKVDGSVVVFTSEFVEVGTVSANAMAVLGSGSVKSFAGEAFAITAEVVIVGEREITVPEATMEDIKKKVSVDPVEFLADTKAGSVTGLSNLERIVLTGQVAEPTIENKPKVVAKAFPTEDGKLAIQLDNLEAELPQIEGATPKFELQGSAVKNADDKGWTTVAENNMGKFEISATELTQKFKFYRVKASVVYPTK